MVGDQSPETPREYPTLGSKTSLPTEAPRSTLDRAFARAISSLKPRVRNPASAEVQELTSFEQKFSETEKLQTKSGSVEVSDIVPENNSDQVPVILVSGWGGTPVTHKDTLRVIHVNKRRAIALKFSRTGGEIQSEKNYPQSELNKAEALLAVIDQKGLTKVDAIAHSEGAIVVVIAAEIAPEKFRNIVFVDPAGLIGKDNPSKLVARFGLMLAKDSLRSLNVLDFKMGNRLRAAREAVKYLAKNPVRSIQEASDISAADIYEILTFLKKSAIGVSIIHGVNDTIFPMKALLRTAEKRGGIDTTGFYSVKGDHMEVSVHPEKYAALAIDALNGLKRHQ